MATLPPRPKPAAKRKRPGKLPGPAPLVLQGFTWNPPSETQPAGVARWAAKSPAAEVLAALGIGATWEHAAHYARLHEATPRQWNSRGDVALGEDANLAVLVASGADRETLAYAAFAVAAAEARGAPVLGALEQIDRARRAGDWKAGAHMLRVLPQARPYVEVHRQEVTGSEGGAVEVDVAGDLTRTVLDVARRIADETAAR